MHLCLFDIDGTLVSTGGAGVAAFMATLAEEFGVAEINRDVSFAGRSDRAIALDLFAAHGVEPSHENWEQFRRAYVRRLTEGLPRHQGRVLPGVFELLDELRCREDVLIGLLTGNIRQVAERKLSHYKLWHHFPFGGFGDDHLDRNDIAAAALAAAHQHADSAAIADGAACRIDGTVLVLGDTPNDVRCARSIGALCVAVPTGQTPAETLRQHQPDLLVDSLDDAAPILELLSKPV